MKIYGVLSVNGEFKMSKEVKAIYIAFFLFIVFLFSFLGSGDPLILFVSLSMLGAALIFLIYIKII